MVIASSREAIQGTGRILAGLLRIASLGLAMFCAPLHAETTPSVELQAPSRTFGYFIGDTMDATATITADPGAVFEAASLPAEGPISTWIDLRRINVSQDRSAGALHVVLHLQYQSFFDPEEASQGSVPGFDVGFLAQGRHVTAHVPGFGFMASPFRHVLQPVIESSALQPDHPFLKMPVQGLQLRTAAAAAVAIVAALLLAARLGLLPVLGIGGRPFATAHGRIARLPRGADPADAARDAMLELHRAFDRTAGRRVLAPDLESFVGQHTRFAKLRPDIENFFAESRDFFFGAQRQQAGPALQSLAALGRRLSRAERAK